MCGLPAKYQILLYFVMALLALSAQGCQKPVYLMPTPAIWATGELNPFSINPKLEEGSRVDVFFATNRSPRGDSENRAYSIFPGTKLRVGTIHFTIGGKEKEAGTLSVRTLDGNVKYGVSHQSFLDSVLPHIRNRELSLDIFGT